jgi:hypothetical protein
MAFKREKKNLRVIELTSLIDVVFLLLIFFLISFAFSMAGSATDSRIYSEMELPKTETELPILTDDILENLMIQIGPDTTAGVLSRRVHVLWPSYDDTLKYSRTQAFSNSVRDSTFSVFPPQYLVYTADELGRVPAANLIRRSLSEYVDKERRFNRNSRPVVEVRAEHTTEFKLINFVMQECSVYNDQIPRVVIRTVP